MAVDTASRWHLLPDRSGADRTGLLSTPLRIGEKLSITGEIIGEGDLELAGRFDGLIRVQGTVVVTERAEVDADITATIIVVGGRVRGNLRAASRVEIVPPGLVAGNVTARSLTVADGARLKGDIMIGLAVAETPGDGVHAESSPRPPTSIGQSTRSSGRIG